VAEVSERLGVSSHSLYKWVKAVKPGKTEQHEADLVEASRVYSVCPKTSQARSHSFLIAWPRGVSWRSSNRPWPPVRSVD
jgi:transposase-like protein